LQRKIAKKILKPPILGVQGRSGASMFKMHEYSDARNAETCAAGTECRTTPQQLTEIVQPRSTPWLTQFGLTSSQWTEHYRLIFLFLRCLSAHSLPCTDEITIEYVGTDTCQ